jgi:hypothetical protein
MRRWTRISTGKRPSRLIRLSLQNILIDLQSLKLIDFHLLLQSAQRHLFNVLGALASMFKTSSQLRLENLALAATTRRLAAVGSQTVETDAR